MSKIILTFPNSNRLMVDNIEENVSNAFGQNRHRFTAYIVGEQKQTAKEIMAIIGDDVSEIRVESDKVVKTINGLNSIDIISWTVSDADPVGRTAITISETVDTNIVPNKNEMSGTADTD